MDVALEESTAEGAEPALVGRSQGGEEGLYVRWTSATCKTFFYPSRPNSRFSRAIISCAPPAARPSSLKGVQSGCSATFID